MCRARSGSIGFHGPTVELPSNFSLSRCEQRHHNQRRDCKPNADRAFLSGVAPGEIKQASASNVERQRKKSDSHHPHRPFFQVLGGSVGNRVSSQPPIKVRGLSQTCHEKIEAGKAPLMVRDELIESAVWRTSWT